MKFLALASMLKYAPPFDLVRWPEPPEMETHLLAAPAGFSSSIAAINALAGAGDVFAAFVAEVVTKTNAYGRISVDVYREKLAGAGVSLSEREIQNAALGIEFIVTCVAFGAPRCDCGTPFASALVSPIATFPPVRATLADHQGLGGARAIAREAELCAALADGFGRCGGGSRRGVDCRRGI